MHGGCMAGDIGGAADVARPDLSFVRSRLSSRHKEQISGNSDHPVQHSDKKMKRYVGNRHLVNFENALVCYYMAEKYREWLKEHCMTLEENKLQHRLYMKLHSEEILAAILARALWFVAVLQPMRVAVESKRVGNSYVDMFKVVAALNKISMAGLNGFEEDDSIFDQSFDPFDLIKDESGVSKYR